MNWELADHNFPSPWRLQELPDTELKVAHSDQPSFGRRYEIFHNQVRVGILELSAGYRYTAEKPNLITRIDLKFIRLFSLEAIGSFLGVIIKHVCSDDTNSQERAQATRAVESAVMRVLWENQRIHQHTRDRHWGEIRVDIRGTASGWYFRRREALYKQQAP